MGPRLTNIYGRFVGYCAERTQCAVVAFYYYPTLDTLFLLHSRINLSSNPSESKTYFYVFFEANFRVNSYRPRCFSRRQRLPMLFIVLDTRIRSAHVGRS